MHMNPCAFARSDVHSVKQRDTEGEREVFALAHSHTDAETIADV